MKVEIDFDEALDEFVKEKRASSYCKPSPGEIARYISKLLETLLDYSHNTLALIEVIEAENNTVKLDVLDHFRPEPEPDNA